LQFIKAARPEVQIDWLVEQSFAELLADNPDISRILTVNLKALKSRQSGVFKEIAKIKAYAAEAYDLVIDAQGLLKSALAARLLSGNCIGFDKNSIRETSAAWFYRNTVACAYHENTIRRNLTVLTQPLGLQVTDAQIAQKQAFLFFRPPQQAFSDFLSPGQPTVLLVIGSTWPSRNYPKEQFLQVVAGLQANCLICWGNEQEKQAAEWIAARSSARVLPRLSLNDLKALMAQTDLVIGNDTGPTHMAWGLNRPSITLFGPTPVSRVWQTEINRVLKSSSVVNPYKLDKNDFSIAEIAPAAVVALAESLL
jgi:heptosyltransferase I